MYEYKVIPAPERADRIKGLKRPEDRFAHKVEEVLNDMAAAGWSFLRAESLPGEERRLLRSQSMVHNILVFYREIGSDEQTDAAPSVAPDTSLDSTPPLSGAFRHDPGPPEPQLESPGRTNDDDEEEEERRS